MYSKTDKLSRRNPEKIESPLYVCPVVICSEFQKNNSNI